MIKIVPVRADCELCGAGLSVDGAHRLSDGRQFVSFNSPVKQPDADAISAHIAPIEGPLGRTLSSFQRKLLDKAEAVRDNPYESFIHCGTTSFAIGTLLALDHYPIHLVQQSGMPRDLYGVQDHIRIEIGPGEDGVIVDGAYKQFLTGRVPDETLGKLPNILVITRRELEAFVDEIVASCIGSQQVIPWAVPQFANEFCGAWDNLVKQPPVSHALTPVEIKSLVTGIWTEEKERREVVQPGQFLTFLGDVVCGGHARSPYTPLFRALQRDGLLEVL